jgi:hypothetical protein
VNLEAAISNLLLAKRHAILAAEAMLPEQVRRQSAVIRRQAEVILRQMLTDAATASTQTDFTHNEPGRPTRVTID